MDMTVKKVDIAFVQELEGNSIYAKVPSDKSGVTVGSGFDLKEKNTDFLRKIGLEEPVIARLKPYIGLSGADARAYLAKHPLTLEPHVIKDINEKSYAYYLVDIANQYNKASEKAGYYKKFENLTEAQQTVLFSVGYQYGSLSETPNFFRMAVADDWKGVHNELLNFKDNYTTRRHKEANKLYDDVYTFELPE